MTVDRKRFGIQVKNPTASISYPAPSLLFYDGNVISLYQSAPAGALITLNNQNLTLLLSSNNLYLLLSQSPDNLWNTFMVNLGLSRKRMRLSK